MGNNQSWIRMRPDGEDDGGEFWHNYGDGIETFIPDEIIESYRAEGRAERDPVVAALEGVMKSYECYCVLKDPKPEDNWDHYDYMMYPLWIEAQRVMDELKKAEASNGTP